MGQSAQVRGLQDVAINVAGPVGASLRQVESGKNKINKHQERLTKIEQRRASGTLARAAAHTRPFTEEGSNPWVFRLSDPIAKRWLRFANTLFATRPRADNA